MSTDKHGRWWTDWDGGPCDSVLVWTGGQVQCEQSLRWHERVHRGARGNARYAWHDDGTLYGPVQVVMAPGLRYVDDGA